MSFKEIESDLQDTVNKISLTVAVITCLIWALIGYMRPGLVNRVTLRFQVVIAFIDILRHTSLYNVRVSSDTWCALIGASINFSDHIYVAFNLLLAVNAHLIFIRRKRPNMKFYSVYATAALMYIIILNICYYTNGAYGRGIQGRCNFRTREDKIVTRFYMVYLMEGPGVLYCAYVVFLVMFKFRERMSKLRIIRNNSHVPIEEEGSEPIQHILALYWRISMYPISCFITMFPFLVTTLLIDAEQELPLFGYFIFRICRRLPGITNFFFMLYDPHFIIAFKELIVFVKDKLFRRSKAKEIYELKDHHQSIQGDKEPGWYDRMAGEEEWKIEFHDGYKMPLQDHIKYL